VENNPYKSPSNAATDDPRVSVFQWREHEIEVTAEYLPWYFPLIPRYRVLASGKETFSTLVLSSRFVFPVIDDGKEIPLLFESNRDSFRTGKFHIYSQDGLVAESAVVMKRWPAKQILTIAFLVACLAMLGLLALLAGD
jgi:hypothetical protein